ncbi:MAG: CotH kinase family protein [Planctomycetota bacterium]|jgi:hypothetical protein
MDHRRHLLRDVFILTLPATALLVYLVCASVVGFYNSEIRNFHGYLTRGLRIGGPAQITRETVAPILQASPTRYLPLTGLPTGKARRVDLRIRGEEFDELVGDLPHSKEEWHRAVLFDGGVLHDVQVRLRGQMFPNFFGRTKAWKIKTRKRDLFDGYRVINLSRLQGDRMSDHLSFLAAREVGLPASRTRIVHLYVNHNDQGLYLQEEQIDESMMRRCGRMPGDIFYGEALVPDEANLGSSDLFWNAALWRKKARHNRYPEEYRPYLTELLDHVNDPSLDSYGRMYDLLALDEYALYFGLLSFYGDQHTDRTHNHKLFFNPLTGRFEGIVWNVISTMPRGLGLETTGNVLFEKLCRDPRFLDRVHRLMQERFVARDVYGKILAEADRLNEVYGAEALSPKSFAVHVGRQKTLIEKRAETVERQLRVADVALADERNGFAVYARSAASLRLRSITLDGEAQGARVFEDRDFDGEVGPDDVELAATAAGATLRLAGEGALLYTGRDFRASYYEPASPAADTFSQFRMYSRLAYLRSPFLLVSSTGATRRAVAIDAVRTVGSGDVSAHRGAPDEYVATRTIHPWRFGDRAPARELRFSGEVRLDKDLIVREGDSFTAEPGTRFLLAPGVSIVIGTRVGLSDISVERADPERPWGVFVLQGAGASDSRISGSTFRGGSHDTLRHVYYSGMVSIHYADRVTFKDCVFADNILGDDTLRFGRCFDLSVEGCRVDGANGDAIDCDISRGTISDTQVNRPRNDGIDLMTADVALQRNTIVGAGDKGISFGESASPEVADCRIVDCVMGIGLKDASDPTLRRVEIRGCRVGVSGYDKNWRYAGGGRGTLIECRLFDNGRDVILDANSTLGMIRCVVGPGFRPSEEDVRDGRLQIVDLERIEDPQ